MAKEDKQPTKFPFQPVNGSDEKPPRKTPKFSIYWIYTIIFAVLIGSFFTNMKPDFINISEQDFKNEMLVKGDVEKINKVTNGSSNIVRVFIKADSINKEFYIKKIGKRVDADKEIGRAHV